MLANELVRKYITLFCKWSQGNKEIKAKTEAKEEMP